MAQRFKWDSKSVIDAVGRVKAEALRLSGVEIQRSAKRSMKKAKSFAKKSEPGKAPFAHTGALKNSIRFAWDVNTQSVVVGPIKFEGKSKGAKALEYGGIVNVKVIAPGQIKPGNGRKMTAAEKERFKVSEKGKAWIEKKKSERKSAKRITVQAEIKPRPAMNPALKKEIKKFPELLKKARNKFNK